MHFDAGLWDQEQLCPSVRTLMWKYGFLTDDRPLFQSVQHSEMHLPEDLDQVR
jgi:hypothetical protein